MSNEHDTETDALAHNLAVVLARVRCEAIHGQTNNGRCVSCISWARNVGVPRHLPQFLPRDIPPVDR